MVAVPHGRDVDADGADGERGVDGDVDGDVDGSVDGEGVDVDVAGVLHSRYGAFRCHSGVAHHFHCGAFHFR